MGANIVGIRRRVSDSFGTTQRRAPPRLSKRPLLDVVRLTLSKPAIAMWAAPESPPFPHVADTTTDLRAPPNAADEEASYPPKDCTLEGCASVNGTALAVAKGPSVPRGMTPVLVASGCSR